MNLEDPKTTIKSLLSYNWDVTGVGFTPIFSDEWYNPREMCPQVVVSHISTPICYVGLGATKRRYEGTYAVDVWAQGDGEKRWKMKEEVDRIVHLRRRTPGVGLTFIRISSWRDMDELDRAPKIFRSQIQLVLLYFKA
ncbi:MAG: hypothetical protein QXJ75_05640 [Candidatus Bathyarchaeia archaeon]